MSVQDVEDARIPVTLLTGFLGSGKTTLVNALVGQPVLSDTLVIVNEFGEIGLDHLLFAHCDGDLVVEMSSGCICCSINSNLAKTLREALWRFSQAGQRRFSRVLVETTGLADPVPIVHTVLADPAIAAAYRIAGVVTAVDAVNGLGTLERHEEAARQVAMADLLLLTKTDIADPDALSPLSQALRELNPSAEQATVVAGRVDAQRVLGLQFDLASKAADVHAWLDQADYQTVILSEDAPTRVPLSANMLQPGWGLGMPASASVDVNRHSDSIRAFCFVLDKPIPAASFDAWLNVTVSLFGDRFLRLKGIVNLEGSSTPTIIHGVQHVFHPPVQMEAWPDANRTTRLVFITDNLPRAVIEASLVSFLLGDQVTSRPPAASL